MNTLNTPYNKDTVITWSFDHLTLRDLATVNALIFFIKKKDIFQICNSHRP